MNNINVTLDPHIVGVPPRIKMDFLNGTITIPNYYGGFVVAPGCGSGKTTAIKQLIEKEYHYGVLYAAATIGECNLMYQFCRTLINGTSLKDEDIIVLHSDYRSEGTDENLWRNNPNALADKKIIICTHYKLLNEMPELLTNYTHNMVRRVDLSPQKRAMFSFNRDGVDYLPRQLILVDEVPTCGSLNVKISKSILKNLGTIDHEKSIGPDGKVTAIAKRPITRIPFESFEDVKEVYEDIVTDDKSSALFKGNDALTNLKTELILGIIHDNYVELSTEESDDLRVTYSLADLVLQGMKSRVIIFEGTGDLTFTNSSRFELLTYRDKYNSPIEVSKIHDLMNISRKESNPQVVKSWLDSSVEVLSRIISDCSKTLIITWMNMKPQESRESTLSVESLSLNEELKIPDYLTKKLESLGLVSGVNFNVIHYQSGMDKATNKFIDCDSIVFLGEFHVPNYVVGDFNDLYKCRTSVENFTLYQLVQAVCRTRIRLHNKSLVKIYYTDDWSDNLMSTMIDYISSGNVPSTKGIVSIGSELSFIKNKWRPEVNWLMTYDPQVRESIVSMEKYEVKVDLDVIYDAFPKSKKEVSAYWSLMRYLESLGITLTITSTRRLRR